MLALPPPALMRGFRVILVLALVPMLSGGGDARQDAAQPIAAQCQLHAPGDARSRGTDDHRLRPPHLAQHLAPAGHRTALPPATGTPGATRSRPGCASRRSAGDTSLAARPADDRGSIDLTTLAIAASATDLLPRAQFIAPDDGNADDRTVSRVPLDRPVAPGETIVIDLGWTAQVPRTFARTGAIGNYFFIAHWFPKIGVLEDSGWNCHQFHAATEFFADFGVYDVSLTVPSRLDRRRHRPSSSRRPTTRQRHDDAPVPAGRRARLRLDDEPGLRRTARTLRGSRAFRRSTSGCCCSPSTPSQADPALRGGSRRAEVLRHLVRSLSVRPAHRRRSGRRSSIAQAQGEEHRAAWSTRRSSPRARAGSRRGRGSSRRASRSTRPATSSGTASSPPTSSSTRGWTRAQHLRRRPACWRKRFRHGSSRSSATSAASCRGRTPTRRGRATIDGNRLNAYRPARQLRRAVDADLAVLAGIGGRDVVQQDGAVARPRSSGCSAGRRCSRSWRRTSRAARSGIRRRTSSSRSRAKSAARTSRGSSTPSIAARRRSTTASPRCPRRPATRPWSCGGSATACFPSIVRVTFDDGHRRAERGTDASDGARSGSRSRRRVRTVEVDPGRVLHARSELHEQLVDGAAARRRGLEEVGAALAHVARRTCC